MNISINKDIEKYQESVIMGLTAKQLICSIIALALGTGIVLSTFKYVGLTVSVYIAIPIVAPIALNGFYEYQGMSFTEMMKRKIRCLFKNPQLIYISEEGESLINEMHLEDMNRQKLDNKKNKKSKIKKANNKKNKGYINNSQNHKRKDGNNGNI